MRAHPGNDLNLGRIGGSDKSLVLPRTMRDKHLYVAGGTGTGKSKFLESLVRQDIMNWRKSKCGLMLVDPHGSLYDGIVQWLATHNLDRPVVTIDLRESPSILSYNPLRHRVASPAVVIDNMIEAMAHVWGQSGTNETPLLARWAGNLFRVLYDRNLPLSAAVHVLGDPVLRRSITCGLSDAMAERDWSMANGMTVKDFESQVSSTVNRLLRFLRNETMRTIFGQPPGPPELPTSSLDLGTALEEGHIILVSLAREGAKVAKENASLLATLLLTDLWTAAQERGKRKGVKPFYVYLDEFQRFVTPTIAENLDEARGYGLHLTLAHQFPKQLRKAGPSGERVYDSVMENASSKVVFRLSDEDNLKPLALWLFRGVMDPDQVKHQLFSTKVMGYREEERVSTSRTTGRSMGSGIHITDSTAAGAAGTDGSEHESWTEHTAESFGESTSWSQSESESESRSTVLVPVMGKELSHVQFRSLEEQVFRAMATLFSQQERHAVVRLVGMNVPVSMTTTTVKEGWANPDRMTRYIERMNKRWPFLLPVAQATMQMIDHDRAFVETMLGSPDVIDEPVSAKRRVR